MSLSLLQFQARTDTKAGGSKHITVKHGSIF
jgi:hypothetical protein